MAPLYRTCRVTHMRRTHHTQRVLSHMLQEPDQRHYGFDLSKAAGLRSGTLYPILSRLEANGWVQSDWEHVDDIPPGRPRRRYYKLTADGLREAREYLA